MKQIIIFCLSVLCYQTSAQTRMEAIPFGNFDRWVEREIKESVVLGGQTKDVYAIAPNEKIVGATPYKNKGGSQWSSSNVLAIVAGIVKTSNTVFPDNHPAHGRCARMETHLETCKVLGIVNISVLASGTIFLGETIEPIRSTSNPYSKMVMGVPYTKSPKALVLDYKAKVHTDNKLTKATGTSVKTLNGRDWLEVLVYLQKRWEDADGNVYAKRVGTMRERIGESTSDWVENRRFPIAYGNISSSAGYKSYMALIPETFYTRNSKGEMTIIRETGWAAADEQPTHIILMLSSGCHGAYTGALGNTLWVDDVRFEF